MAGSIDLNSDLGEGFGPWTMGDDQNMLEIVTSANIACGGHASDPETMYQTLRMARQNNVRGWGAPWLQRPRRIWPAYHSDGAARDWTTGCRPNRGPDFNGRAG